MGEFLNTKEAAEMLRMEIRTLYNITAKRLIPFYKPGGKLILFKRSELINYLENSQVRTQEAISNEQIKNLKR